MSRASFTHQASVLAPRTKVWDRLQRAETWADIGPVEHVWDAVHDEEGHLRSYRWSTTVAMRRYEGTARTIEAHRPELMRLELNAKEIVGTLTTHLEDGSSHETTLVVTLDIEARGMLSMMFFSVVSDAVGRGLPQQVERFAETLRAAPRRQKPT